MINQNIQPVIRKFAAAVLLPALAIGCLLLAGVAQAQTPINQLHFSFGDAPGSTTTTSDTALNPGAIVTSVSLFNASSPAVLTDLHGAIGSGVTNLGVLSSTRALDFTADIVSTQTNQPANSKAAVVANASAETGNNPASGSGNAALAYDLGDTSLLNLGTGGAIGPFVATIWANLNAPIPTGETVCPRLWILNTTTGASGGLDTGGAGAPGSLGLKWQQNNQVAFSFGSDNPTLLGTLPSGTFPTNTWMFFCVVYDSTNFYIYYGTAGSSPTVIGQVGGAGNANRTYTLSTSGTLVFGNRRTATTYNVRGLDGWLNDFRFYSGVGNAAFVHGVWASALGNPPVVTGIYPDGTQLQQGTNKLSFTASSLNGNNISSVKVLVNGADVSSQLVTSGPSTNLSVSYTGLPLNMPSVTAAITVTDAKGLVGATSVTFDTFSPTNFTWEAEEFDYVDPNNSASSGLFINNPDYTDATAPPDTNSYFGLDSTELIDTHKGNGNGGINASDYRAGATLATKTQTPVATGELPRLKFINNPDTNAVDHIIANIANPDWQNYTKTFPAGLYNIYGRFSGGSGGSIPITLARVTSGQGTVNQTTTNIGTFTYTSSGTVYQYAPLLDAFGNLATVNLAGTNTLRTTWGSGGSANFYMLVPANTNLPTITQVFPDGTVLFQATNRFVFTASSSANINTNSIHLSLNGIDVSSNLVFTGGPSVWNVVYNGLKLDQSYTVVISVTDGNGGNATSNLKIDTYNPILQFEAEDFDFDPASSPISNGTGNRYIDNAVPSTVAQANSYFGQVGDELIDENGNNNGNAVSSLPGYSTSNYRVNDRIMTSPVSDAPRSQFVSAGAGDYNIGFLGGGFWETYTRTFPAGTYNVYGRMASGNGGTIHIRTDQVIEGWGTVGQIVTNVGTFNCPGTGGYAAYLYVPMLDKFGNYANVTLNGTNTFRTTEDNPVNINFYMLLAARTDLPRIDSVSPDGSTLMQGGTSTLSFIASGTNGIAQTNVHVTLNGVIISNLVFTGSSTSWNVSYTGLAPNTNYTAAISVTDGINQTASTSVTFDTFNPANFTWEAEDFDFGGGLYIDNPVIASTDTTNSYFDQVSSPGVDENYVTYQGTHLYRPSDFIPTEVTSDAPRQRYLSAQFAHSDPTLQDYDVYDWVNTSWINYTHTYPAGSYHVYARLAGGNGAFNPTLGQITSGWGTASQAVTTLGVFKGTGTSFTTWQYVELVDTNTLQPITLNLGGTNTFQVTTDGNVNANFYMLVAASSPATKLTATLSGTNIMISFPTQNGLTYSVSYKNSLTDSAWTTNATITGDGTVKSITDGTGNTSRFYRVGAH